MTTTPRPGITIRVGTHTAKLIRQFCCVADVQSWTAQIDGNPEDIRYISVPVNRYGDAQVN